MRKPVGVTIAAVVLGLLALLGILVSVLAFAGIFMAKNPAMPSPALHQGAGAQAVVACFDAAFACILVFCLWTAVGVFRLRRWARYSVAVIGVLLFLGSGFVSAMMFALPHFAREASRANALPAQLSVIVMILQAFGALYAAIALIGLWWAVYFNLKHVRLAFAGGAAAAGGSEMEPESLYGPWRIVVIAVACMMLLGVPVVLGMAWLRLPFMVLGMFFHGNSARAVALVFAAIQLFAGIGLVARVRPGYWAAVAWEIFGVLSTALLMLPAYAARVTAAGEEATRRLTALPAAGSRPFLSAQQHFLLLTGALSVAIFLVSLYALLRCRRWYLGGGPAADAA